MRTGSLVMKSAPGRRFIFVLPCRREDGGEDVESAQLLRNAGDQSAPANAGEQSRNGGRSRKDAQPGHAEGMPEYTLPQCLVRIPHFSPKTPCAGAVLCRSCPEQCFVGPALNSGATPSAGLHRTYVRVGTMAGLRWFKSVSKHLVHGPL